MTESSVLSHAVHMTRINTEDALDDAIIDRSHATAHLEGLEAAGTRRDTRVYRAALARREAAEQAFDLAKENHQLRTPGWPWSRRTRRLDKGKHAAHRPVTT